MSNRRKQPSDPDRQERTLPPGEASIIQEVDYIVHRAQQHDVRVVTLGDLLLFSTASGDAWLLDLDDQHALCLARDGVRQAVRIVETEQRFAIEWDRTFHLDGDLFSSADRSGRTTTVLGYPVKEIVRSVEILHQRGLRPTSEVAHPLAEDPADDISDPPEGQVDLSAQLEAIRRHAQSMRPNPRASGSPFRGTAPHARGDKLGRNDLCWCGSGKKYKYCHLRQDQK